MSNALATGLLVLVVAMSISMLMIPWLVKWAPALGMIDNPDDRKVHATPIPRAGGIGIVLGALIPLLIWLPWNDVVVSFFLGSVILLVFGVWDDIKELGHYVKFVGQFLAVLLVVYYGDLYVTNIPFLGNGALGEDAGRLFTVFAMVGMINAINHSDGLDGLAGGESLLSLGAIAYLAFQAQDLIVVFIAVATIGGVFGFLRFNSHPARVFMGDSGSQVLGFTLGFLAVYLTQVSNPALSPAVAALLLGLPVVDIISVFVQRIYGGMNWFRATSNHIHHRLLRLGFEHYQSVIVIYSVQAILVLLAVLLPYESDGLLIGIYLAMTVFVFGALVTAERSGWRMKSPSPDSALMHLINGLEADSGLMVVDRAVIRLLLSLFVLSCAVFTVDVPQDLSIASVFLFVALLARLVLGYRVWFLSLRLMIYVAMAFVAYLVEYYPPELFASHDYWLSAFYVVTGLAVVMAVRYSRGEFFRVTPLDYLVVLIVLVLTLLSENGFTDVTLVALVVKLIVLFYGSEIVLKYMRSRWDMFTVSVLVSLALIGGRQFL